MYDNDNNEISRTAAAAMGATYTYSSNASNVATVDNSGVVTCISPGESVITVNVTIGGVTCTGELNLNLHPGKTSSSYYTPEKVAAARENANLYSWAKTLKDDAVKKAELYVDKSELLWSMVTTQELPRSYEVGGRTDPEVSICRYCGANVAAKTGRRYVWDTSPLNHPWKIQCPVCKRRFPSNDFGGFYKLGIDEQGMWSYELAKERNKELVENGEDGYLKNILYPEKGIGWGVDDGYGYDTGNTYPNGVREVHTYISFYNHWGLWYNAFANVGIIPTALEALRNAYIYTGEAKYGRTGAILIDRIADVYPEMDVSVYMRQYLDVVTPGSLPAQGKIVDRIWSNDLARWFCQAYDAFYPMYDDPQVISFLSGKAALYNMENTKQTAELIRKNCEDGILRDIYKSVQEGVINGNFGMHQSALAYAAVVLDSMPESREMIDWVFKTGETYGNPPYYKVTGGNVSHQIITDVDRDGLCYEMAPNYVEAWVGGLRNLMDALGGYKGYSDVDMFKN